TVSTPYWHAQELLADGRGRLVPFKDPGELAEAVNDLFDREVQRHAMRSWRLRAQQRRSSSVTSLM
ncbi:MAG: hypothetical protein AAGA94_16795, partial [Pseudomonadota bacterium]